jgi:hypothetical protein
VASNSEILNAIDAASSWLDIDGVEGVAQGEANGETVIEVGCSRPVAELADKIPDTFRGYRVVLEYWGSISAQDPG